MLPDPSPLRRRASLSVLGFAAVAAGAQAPAPPVETFGAVLDVRVINVEVVVTDRDGVVVRGLPADAFVLEVDGEPVEVEYFTEVRGGVAVEDSRPGGRELASVPALSPGEPVGTSYLLFLDDLFSIEADRNEVLDQMSRELPLMGPNDRMAVVAFDGRELDLLSSWSQSPTALERVLREAGRRPTYGIQRLVDRRRMPARRRGVGGFPTLSPEERSYALQLADQVDRVVRAATATLRGFAMPPGRKVMMIVSGGWPFRATSYAAGSLATPVVDDLGIVEGEELFGTLAQTANSLGYTLYAAHAPGGRDRLADPASGLAADRRQELYGSLRFLAEETGGRAYLARDREKIFSRTVGDTRSYYWLGFTPDRAWDDRAHDIQVRVSSPDLRVRTRAGFEDLSRASEVAMAVESALHFGGLPGSQSLTVEFGEPRKSGFRKVRIPVTLELPMEELTFLPQGDRWLAQVEVRFAVRDAGFHQADIPAVPLLVEAVSEPVAGSTWSYSTEVRLRRRRHEMIVAVHDAPSGRIHSRRVVLDP